jgi:hypothetical protein
MMFPPHYPETARNITPYFNLAVSSQGPVNGLPMTRS